MSEYKLKEIFAPQLSGQPYGQNLKEQFDAINANFKLLANRDFVKGDKGDSMRAILDPIYDNELTPVGSQVVEALLADALGPQTWVSYKGGWDAISPKTIDNINDWAKNNNITSLLPTEVGGKDVSFIDNVINLSLIRIQTFDPSETNPIYTDVAFANNFVLRDNRFVGAALSESDLTHYDEKIDVSGTVALTVVGNDNYATTVLHDFPTLYYKQDVFRWKIGGQETGIIAQGPSGANGKDGTIYMVKVSNNHPSGDSKKNWCQIDAVWDRIGSDWKPNSEDPKPVTDYIKDGDTCVAFLDETTEESETTSSKIYITTVVSSNNVLYAICDSTQQIQFEAGLDIVEKFMNGLPYNLGQPTETDWIGLHVQDSQSNNDGQPFYQHMIHSESLEGNQEAGKLGDLIIEPMNRKDGVGPATDPTARLNLKYNKIRLGFDGMNDFGSEVRDSQIIANLYGTYIYGKYTYWDRSSLTISKKSYQSSVRARRSITNISHDWVGKQSLGTKVSHALNIGSEYLTISKDGNWDSEAALLCIYTASNKVDISACERDAWRDDSIAYVPLNIGCSVLNVTSEDVYLGGKVQIGSAEHLSGLEVYGASTFKSKITIVENDSQGATKTLEYSQGNLRYRYSNTDSAPLHINGKLGDAKAVSIGSVENSCSLSVWGNASIGTTANSANLKVYGDIEASGAVTSNGDIISKSRIRGHKGCLLSMWGDWNEEAPTLSIETGTLNIPIDWDTITADEMTTLNDNTIVVGKGLLIAKIAGQDGDSEKYEITIQDAPSCSLIQLGVKIVNTAENHQVNNVYIYIKSKSGNDSKIWGPIDVPSGSREPNISKEFLIWLDSNCIPKVLS